MEWGIWEAGGGLLASEPKDTWGGSWPGLQMSWWVLQGEQCYELKIAVQVKAIGEAASLWENQGSVEDDGWTNIQ